MPTRFHDSEDRAASVVSAVTRGKPVRRDDGKTPGVRDFDILFDDGHIEPLEVTRGTLPELNKALDAHNRRGKLVQSVPGLTRQWHVFSSTATSFKDLTASRLADVLVPLENSAIDTFMLPMDAFQAPQDAVQAARAAGLLAAFAHMGEAGKIVVSPPNDDHIWSSDHSNPGRHAIGVAEDLASKPDNRHKLAVRGIVNSHLFIWIDETNYLPWADLLGELPNRAPSLPPEITIVWLATRVNGLVICWSYAASRGWTAWSGIV